MFTSSVYSYSFNDNVRLLFLKIIKITNYIRSEFDYNLLYELCVLFANFPVFCVIFFLFALDILLQTVNIRNKTTVLLLSGKCCADAYDIFVQFYSEMEPTMELDTLKIDHNSQR